MITINNLEIINGGSHLAIDVKTEPGSFITSLMMWSMDNFKDYSLAVDLTSRLEKVNNREVLLVPAGDLNVQTIEDLVFIEVESDYVDENCSECNDCNKAVIGITYDMSKYYKCLMAYLLDADSNNCDNCGDSNKEMRITIAINLMIDTISKALDAGYYIQAIEMIKNLKKICNIKECKNCQPIICKTCNQFKQQ